jgi:antitoxin component YwqK of YwqJK toxin-antitoxin module
LKNLLLILSNFFALIVFAQSYEIDPFNKKDTINKIDVDGKKQGKWMVLGKTKTESCYSSNSIVEEGQYYENKKIGVWKDYHCNGNLKTKITYVNGRPDGPASKYYENGKLKEEGIWKISKWVGEYKLFYANGQLHQEFNFNTNGKREGTQRYFHENGKIMIEGNWASGQESGVIKEYYDTGELKSEKNFNSGAVDLASIKDFDPKKPLKPEAPKESKKVMLKKEEIIENVKPNTPLILNGYHVLFNKNRQVSKDGDFKDNTLINGKNYIYDENGILLKIEVYKNGYYVGNAQIED